jgi:hypothetical protein
MESEFEEINLKDNDGKWLSATIVGIDADVGDYGPQYKWTVRVDDGHDRGEVTIFTTQKYTRYTKLGGFVHELNSEYPKRFITDEYEGVECEVQIGKRLTKSGAVKQDKNGEDMFTIVKFRPVVQTDLKRSTADDYENVSSNVS